MKLNVSKAKTMSLAQRIPCISPPITIGGTVLKESDDLDTLGVTFDSKMTFEKHLHSVSRAASQRLGILMKLCHAFNERFSLRDACGILSCEY